MAKSQSEARRSAPRAAARKEGYFEWSRDPAVGLFAVLPLWVLYEALRFSLTPNERNGAEALVSNALVLARPYGLTIVRVLLLVTVLLAARSIHRRSLPWGKVALVSALEGTVYGLMLGPLASVLVEAVPLHHQAALLSIPFANGSLTSNLVGSLGAGIFEEAVFRLGLLSLFALAATRACVAFALPQLLGIMFAVLASSVLFSLFHHLGPLGEPFMTPVFLFRLMAGVLLGVLFVMRGFAVVVYTHAFYDVHYYLTHP